MPFRSSSFPPLAAAALALACLLLYWPATGHQFVDVDDAQFVRENPWVQDGLGAETIRWAFTQSHASNWLPFTFLSLAIDSSLFGTEPGPYHRTNVLLHALAAALLFGAMRALTQSSWIALAIAALWALHPLRVESVAWIAERKDVLSGAFGFASLWAYAAHVRGGRRGLFWLSCALLLCGLLAKAMLVSWPFVFLLLDRWPLRRNESFAARLREKVPMLVMVLGVAIATVVAQRAGGAVSTLRQLAFGDRLANAAVSMMRYVGDLLWPHDLAYLYPHPALLAPDFGWPMAIVGASAAAVVGISVLLWWFSRRGFAAGWTGWLFYLGTLLPVLGILQVGIQSKADRYTYIPHVGLLLALGVGLGSLVEWRPRWRAPVVALVLVALGASGWQTRRQLPFWSDSEALFRRAIAVTRDNAYAQNGLGAYLGQRGDLAGARPHLEEALRIDPQFAEAHLNLGIVLSAGGDLKGARSHYERARSLDPGSGLVHLNLGILEAMEGRLEAAESSLLRARELGPARWQAEFNLALVQKALGKNAEAMDSLRRAQRLNPSNPSIRAKWAEWNGGH